jgi:hypothetical protein
MSTLFVIHPTVLKQDPTQQASELLPEQTHPLPLGAHLEVVSAVPVAGDHLQITLPAPLQGDAVWYVYARHVVRHEVVQASLEAARDREAVFQKYLDQEVQEGSDQLHLSFLDRGVETSPYQAEIPKFPDRLRLVPDGTTLTAPDIALPVLGGEAAVSYMPYPAIGYQPRIHTTGLDFLHPLITQACVCVGSFVDRQLWVHWLGRDAFTQAQFWSATKIVPLVNIACRANSSYPHQPIGECWVRDPQGRVDDIQFLNAATEMISYAGGAERSNSLAGMFKRFSSRAGLEQWWQALTDSPNLEFRGGYGAAPWIENPVLKAGSTTLLTSPPAGSSGDNLVTAYDLTRLVTLLGWHCYLSSDAKLPAAQWHSLAAVVQAMAADSARYLDVAIATLGLQTVIQQPVILSKLGFGASSVRDQTELTYTALLQFVDPLPVIQGKLPVLRMIALTLRAAIQLPNRDLAAEARAIDARMAAEVTELVRRLVL